MLKKSFLVLIALTATLFASSVEVKDSYVRATPPGLPNSGAFMTIVNNSSKDISLVSAASKIAKAVELHTHDMKDGVMKMYQVPKIDIKANSSLEFKPGGFHVMFIGLNGPLKVGEKVDFSIKLATGETLKVTAPIKTVMGGMMKKKGMSCGAGKCGGSMKKKEMSCGAGKCGGSMKKNATSEKKMSCGQGKCGK